MAESTSTYDLGPNEAMRAPNPEETLRQARAEFISEADAKEAEARDLEDRMMLLRAEAAGLRSGAAGLGEALEVYAREVARHKEFAAERDGLDQPARPMPYDARAHANRVP